MKCVFCGHEFSQEELRSACGSCVFKKKCELVRCPQCHYEMAADPAWFKSLIAKRTAGDGRVQNNSLLHDTNRAKGPCLPLSLLQASQKGIISHVHATDHGTWQKIIAMHLLPGTEVELLQNFPSYVFRIGRSQFAVDETIASIVYVSTLS